MKATAVDPYFNLSRRADDVLISETILCPPMSMTTSLMTAPFLTETTLPLNWFRALSGMAAPGPRLWRKTIHNARRIESTRIPNFSLGLQIRECYILAD